MRFTQLSSNVLWRSALDGVGIAVAGVFVAVLLTQRSFEASALVEPNSAEPRASQSLVNRLQRAAATVTHNTAVVAQVQVAAIDRVRISCRSEQRLVALKACEQIANQATGAPSPARIVSSPATPQEPPILAYVLLSVLVALMWFGLRVRQQLKRHIRSTAPEIAGWRVDQVKLDEAGARDEAANTPTRSDIRTLRGLERPEIANASEFEATPGTKIYSKPQSESYNAPAQGKLTSRIVFRVGASPFEPDAQVLTPPTLSQLHEVCAKLLSAPARSRVVRIASGVSSRYAKTQVAAQLAELLAENSEIPVLVLEGDVDAPALHKAMRLEAPAGLGLSEQLQRLSRQVRTGTVSVIRVEGNLHALLESRISSPAAIGLPQFEQLVEFLRAEHDFIIVDGPVLDTWPDSEHLSRSIDDVVMVAAAGTRLRDTHALGAKHFEQHKILGVVTAGDWVATG